MEISKNNRALNHPSPEIKSQKKCFNCGQLNPKTREHAITRCLFGTDPPLNLITVPACEKCNSSISADEELFLIFILTGYHSHPLAMRLWHEKVIEALNNPDKLNFKLMLISKTALVPMHTEAGIYLGEQPVLGFAIDRINSVIEKFVKGLFYRHTRSCFEGRFLHITPTNYNPEEWKSLDGLTGKEFGEGVFKYRCVINPTDPLASWWCLSFYNYKMFFIATAPFEQATKGQQ